MSEEPQNSIPVWPGYEHTFPAPFETVNAAVFHVISIWAEQHRIPVTREDTPGATRYVLAADGQRIAIFILHARPASQRSASTSTHRCISLPSNI